MSCRPRPVPALMGIVRSTVNQTDKPEQEDLARRPKLSRPKPGPDWLVVEKILSCKKGPKKYAEQFFIQK